MERSATLVGLSEPEAASRLRVEGPNELHRPARRRLSQIVVETLSEPMIELLLGASAIYFVLGDIGEALMLAGSAVVTVVVAIVQETRTESVLEALRDLSSPRALVIRDGTSRRISGREVVRGDLVVLSEGDRVPADAVIRSCDSLETDESLLTGESVPVRKTAHLDSSRDAPHARPGGDGLPFVYAGAMVVRGHGIGEVLATGMATEMGKIGKALSEIGTEPSPLSRQTRGVVRTFAVIGIGLSLLVVILYGLIHGGWLEAILAGITIAMSLMPEEFPMVLTIFLVMGAWRISRARVLTRRSATIETLGAATVMCTDKTGTLTQNRMSIAELTIGSQSFVPGVGPAPARKFLELLETGILASEQHPFDPMELAFHDLGGKLLAADTALHSDRTLARQYALTKDLLAMSQAWKRRDTPGHIVAAKGAPEAVAELCRLDEAALAELRRNVDSMAARGMRVLAVARAQYGDCGLPASQREFAFELLGLVGLADPLRANVPDAIRECHDAGIRVAMVTGDYPRTATAIARAAGIDLSGSVLTGSELAAMSDAALNERARMVRVFARIMPEQKLRLVNAFKNAGEVVAMTGDGVNDAPSLRAAHIGIAMGGRGTDVAREAASIVLLDDDFGSIVKAVRLGRRIYDNLLKAMNYLVAIHVPIAGLALLPIVCGWPLIFTPVHIAFLELVIDPVCSIVFEAEREEADLMKRRPRDPHAPLLSTALITRGIFQGICVLVLCAVVLAVGVKVGLPDDRVRALTFLSLVAGNFALIIVNRSFGTSIFVALANPNPAFWLVLSATVAMLAAVMGVPAIRELFRFGSMTSSDFGVVAGVTAAAVTLLEAIKLLPVTAAKESTAAIGT